MLLGSDLLDIHWKKNKIKKTFEPWYGPEYNLVDYS